MQKDNATTAPPSSVPPEADDKGEKIPTSLEGKQKLKKKGEKGKTRIMGLSPPPPLFNRASRKERRSAPKGTE